jgi:hypothetical protein
MEIVMSRSRYAQFIFIGALAACGTSALAQGHVLFDASDGILAGALAWAVNEIYHLAAHLSVLATAVTTLNPAYYADFQACAQQGLLTKGFLTPEGWILLACLYALFKRRHAVLTTLTRRSTLRLAT